MSQRLRLQSSRYQHVLFAMRRNPDNWHESAISPNPVPDHDGTVIVASFSGHGTPQILPPMNDHIRTFLAAWKEQPYTQLRAADHRGFNYDKVAAQVRALSRHIVLSGPYRGMRYFGPRWFCREERSCCRVVFRLRRC